MNNWPVSPERIARGLYWQEALKLVEGCTPVSRGCDNCWSARETAVRAKHPNSKISAPKTGLLELRAVSDIEKDRSVKRDQCRIAFNGSIRLRRDNLVKPLRAKKPRVYAVWNDLFHEDVPGDFIRKTFDVMTGCSQHVFVLLTKRPLKMKMHVEAHYGVKTPKNVWLGVSVEDQKTANERIPLLLETPPAKRFVSYEPALGQVDFTPYLNTDLSGLGLEGQIIDGHGIEILDWLIMGGESGPGARPMNPEWVRSARDQCQEAGVPFFFKQWGPWAMVNGIYKRLSRPADCLLDGREWKELPR